MKYLAALILFLMPNLPAFAADADVEEILRQWATAIVGANSTAPTDGQSASVAAEKIILPSKWVTKEGLTKDGRPILEVSRSPMPCVFGHSALRANIGATAEQQRQVITDPEFRRLWFAGQGYTRESRYASTLITRDGHVAFLGVYFGKPREGIAAVEIVVTRPMYALVMRCIDLSDYGLGAPVTETDSQIAALAAQILLKK